MHPFLGSVLSANNIQKTTSVINMLFDRIEAKYKEIEEQNVAASPFRDNSCYTLELQDTHGDGWNGAMWTWSANSSSVVGSITGTLESGSIGTEALCFSADCYLFEVGRGIRPEEVSWTITNEEGAVAGSGGADTAVELCEEDVERRRTGL